MRRMRWGSASDVQGGVPWVLLALTLCWSAPVLAYAYVGSSVRYLADDYCFASLVREQGLLSAQRHWYLSWRGVFSHTLVTSLAGLVGPRLSAYLPASIITAWGIALVWTTAQFTLMARLHRPILAALTLTALLLYTTLSGTPNVVQSLYWLSGTISYTVPLILLTIYIGHVAYAQRRREDHRPGWLSMVVGAGLTLTAGGFSEVYVATQTGLLLLAIAVSLRVAPPAMRRASLPLLLAGLAGSLLVMAIVVVAPGNAARLAFFNQPPFPVVVVPVLSPLYALLFLAGFVLLSPLTTFVVLAAAAILPSLLGLPYQPMAARAVSVMADRRRAARWIALSLLGPVSFAYASTLYGLFGGPPARAQVILQFIVTIGVALWAVVVLLGMRTGSVPDGGLRRWNARCALLIGGLILIPLLSTWRTLSLAGELRTYAQRWDERDQQLREGAARGARTMVVQALGYTGRLDDLDPDPRQWVSVCVARYYGLESVRAERRSEADFPIWFHAR